METATLLILLIILLLVLCSSFFSSSETGLTAVSRAKIHRLRMEGHKRAEKVHRLRQHKEQLLSALLLGNTLVNIAASTLATSYAIARFGEDEGVLYATIAMTFLILIFGEVLPKTIAFHKSEKVALAVATPMTWVVTLFTPITTLIQLCVALILRLTGMRIMPEETREAYDLEALKGAIDLSHHEGVMVKRDKDMLGGVLDLSHREVGEIMTHRKNMDTVDANMPPRAIIQHVIESSHTRIPIWRDNTDNIVGIVHAQALLKAVSAENIDQVDIQDILSVATQPWYIPENTTLSDQLAAFRRQRNHVALVVDEYGDLMGLVTLEDILEEIVGQIYDETDKQSLGVKHLEDGSYRIKGSVTIRDLNRRLGCNLPDDNAATVAGLIMHEAQTIPEEGQVFTYYGCEFAILKKKGNQIAFIRFRALPK